MVRPLSGPYLVLSNRSNAELRLGLRRMRAGDMTLPQLTNAETNELAIRQYCQEVKRHFLILGTLLCESYDNAYWSITKWESFQDFVESLGIGHYSTVTRLMQVARMRCRNALTDDEIYEIGISKCFLLAPVARDGEISDELREIAKHGTVADLKAELGQACKQLNGGYIVCPRCGAELHGAKWTKTHTQDGISRNP